MYKDLSGTHYRIVKRSFANGKNYYFIQFCNDWLSKKLNLWKEYVDGYSFMEWAIKGVEQKIEIANEKILANKVIKEEIL